MRSMDDARRYFQRRRLPAGRMRRIFVLLRSELLGDEEIALHTLGAEDISILHSGDDTDRSMSAMRPFSPQRHLNAAWHSLVTTRFL